MMGRLSADAQALIRRFAERYPIPATEDECRTWTHRLAQQMRHAYGSGWGHKRADPYRPLSSDVIAYQEAAVLVGYDVILSAGSSDARLVTDGDPIDLTGQVFVVVEPVDHLGGTVPAPRPTPAPEPTPNPCECKFQPTDLSAVLASAEALRANINELRATVASLPVPAVAFPSYVGKLLGFKVVLRPEA